MRKLKALFGFTSSYNTASRSSKKKKSTTSGKKTQHFENKPQTDNLPCFEFLKNPLLPRNNLGGALWHFWASHRGRTAPEPEPQTHDWPAGRPSFQTDLHPTCRDPARQGTAQHLERKQGTYQSVSEGSQLSRFSGTRGGKLACNSTVLFFSFFFFSKLRK